MNQMEEDDLEDLGRDYKKRPKEFCQGLTRNGWWWCRWWT